MPGRYTMESADNSQLTETPKASLREDIAVAGRWFNAWWEGYAFDADRTRRQLRDQAAQRFWRKLDGVAPEVIIANALWGDGRMDPGDAAWTMRHARMLGLPLKARVAVFGAAQGGPIRDLKAGAKWRTTGFARHAAQARHANIETYSEAAIHMNKGEYDGALCFFDLHRETDPKRLLALVSASLKGNAPVAFVDFAAGRSGTRLKSCFDEPLTGTARGGDQIAALIESAGFRISETDDETRIFRPLLAQGFARWRAAFQIGAVMPNARARADYVSALARIAHIWAERHDALRSGQLQVVRIIARKT